MDSMRTKTDVLVELEEIIMQSIYVITMILVACHYHLNYSRRRSIGKYSMSERIEDQIKHLDRLVHFSDTWCVDNLRMNRNAFAKLCYLLRVNGGLADSRHVRVEEKVAMFVNILAHHHKNCTVKFNFMRSGQTVSRYFHAVLQALLRLHSQLLVNPQPVPQDCNDPRWKWFKGCLGALDGTYIKVKVPEIDKPRYRTRKGEIATNVLGVCDRNMRFIYVLPGWEGSAADGRVLRDAISRADGLKVPIGNYYLCDAGYTNGPGFLAPYRRQRYHLKEWGEGYLAPQNNHEYFNMKHASARNIIERCFGLLKMRWNVLKHGPTFYPIKTQNRIIMACCLLHNFIRKEMPIDPIEDQLQDSLDNEEDEAEETNEEIIDTIETSNEWNEWRENLAISMYNEWRRVF